MTTSTTGLQRSTALVLFALAVGGFAIGTTEFATMSLLPYFAPALGIDAPTAGHVISAYALGVVVGAPLLAVLGARLPRRTLLVLLMALFAVGNGLSALAPTYHWMLLFRFISGLPHGAYFGIAALVAASVVPPHRRTVAVGRMFLGLTVATIIGVPLANWLSQAVGWRWSFALVAALGVLTMICVRLLAPYAPAEPDSSPLRELGALKRGQVWLTLGIGAIGFGGLFAVYTYLADILGAVTHVSPSIVPLVMAVFGIGMTLGNLFIPVLADRAVMPTAGGLLVWSAVVLAIFPFTAGNIWTISICVFFVGFGGALGTVLQTRLMDVAEDAQGLAAALNHSAFNFANALGPYLGGLALAAGYGWTSPGWVGSLLAIGGFVLWSVSVVTSRSAQRSTALSNEG
ncbi:MULTISPECIES: MFS transporter [Pseudomonas]|uniref:MFS transporter n=2 Tax=Pseudomonas nitroreducens TaxID=46680 RepID=A0A6G6IRF2_PSENT|nr:MULTISPECIES: MFS transporter [Pseudomonas]MCJ1881586.1 MFS transporter [Pseudomonas nitroreducens]MCJ1897838.1 MFS transporter [Pseudomonas nitroreducens]NMZ62084.1 MFS transporter [Pseudomonas nitroreducens]OBY55722.1 MFS transporter [Pseudomonas sp. AU12215]QIE85533.1 MFS transporter [Pseudomonas nitroreducens]